MTPATTPRIAALILIAVPTAACRTVDDGTSVGNPGDLAMSVGAPKDITATSSTMPVDAMTWYDCRGGSETVAVGQTFDLLDPAPIEAPPGTWCGVGITPGGTLALNGTTPDGSISLGLEVGEITMDGTAFATVNTSFLVELGAPDWLDAADFGTGDILVNADHPLHDTLAGRIAGEAALFEDADSDTVVDDGERNAGPVAEATPDDDDDDDDDEEDDEEDED